MTKKEILNWIEEKKDQRVALTNKRTEAYLNGYFDALDIIKPKIQQLPDDSWIRFDERMPTEEDYDLCGGILLAANEHDISIEESSTIGREGLFTHWKRIELPSKPLPTKAEILEKYNLTEEQLKEIAG